MPAKNLKLVFCFLISSTYCHAQVDTRPLTKVGGMAYFWADNFAIGIERERLFKKAPAFTHGLRLDYDGIDHNLIPAYQFKFYPFYYRTRTPFKGLFVGAAPCFFMKLNYEGSIGPGLAALVGYQWRLGSRASLGLETSWVYMNSIQKEAINEGWNFFFLGFLKFGYQFGKR